ncbi:hypothetical protein [Zooshikella ganghwensis]|uniref:Uncharacterized protein n=1 Tax=Zooshikella ganghwensis TaxID=202772 RepID=A0A4P9VNL7_9GAMM|nr:hypothetical protein [Zooshikella ganghwensis]RDH43710.1 hypothetical protein B9G39_09805 [Zooshikella ganghwensis]
MNYIQVIFLLLIALKANGNEVVADSFNYDFFKDSKHMLEWLHPEPFDAIKSNFEDNFDQQVPGSKLIGLEVIEKPEWLTGAIPIEGDEDHARLKRAGVAFSFSVRVKTPENVIHEIKGVYTWVGVNMDNPEEEMQRTWVDINGTLEEYGSNGALIQRVYFESDENVEEK